MKRTKIDLTDERLVLSHCIADTNFLQKLHGVGNPQLFESTFARTVGTWVWEFFEETGQREAPGKLILEIYHRRKSEVKDEDELDLVQEFLSALSQDWERAEVQSAEWSLQQGIRYFKLRALAKLKETLDRHLSLKDWEAAETTLGEFHRLEVPTSKGIKIMKDGRAIEAAFNQEDEIVFTFPGALGQLLGPIIDGDFIGYFAPMKRGKSYWLKYGCYAAAREGVASLTVNLEMTEKQVTRRDWQMICGSPRHSGKVSIPRFTEDGDIEWIAREMVGVPTKRSLIDKVHNSLRYTCRGGEMITEILPSKNTTVSDIRALVRRYKREGINIKMLNVDYADLLVAENSRLDGRHALDYIWASLRGLGQEEHLAIFTASQTGRMTLQRDAKEQDAAEDVRKLAHVTKAIMLNQSDLERKKGIMRVRCSMQRDNGPSEGEVVVLEQRAIGRCYLDSRFRSEVHNSAVGQWRETDE